MARFEVPACPSQRLPRGKGPDAKQRQQGMGEDGRLVLA